MDRLFLVITSFQEIPALGLSPQSNRTHARARNRIGRSRTLPSVIDRRRAPTGKKRPSRGRYVAVLYPRPIFEQRARPFLLTPPPEFASVGPSSVAEQCSSR